MFFLIILVEDTILVGAVCCGFHFLKLAESVNKKYSCFWICAFDSTLSNSKLLGIMFCIIFPASNIKLLSSVQVINNYSADILFWFAT